MGERENKMINKILKIISTHSEFHPKDIKYAYDLIGSISGVLLAIEISNTFNIGLPMAVHNVMKIHEKFAKITHTEFVEGTGTKTPIGFLNKGRKK